MILKFKKFIKNISAVVLIEFAIVFPVFLLLFLGSIEVSFFIKTQQKQQTAEALTLDFIASLPVLNASTHELLDTAGEAASLIFSAANQGNIGIVLTILQKSQNTNGDDVIYIMHQHRTGDAGLANTQFTGFTPNQANTDITQTFINNNIVNNSDLVEVNDFMGYDQLIFVETNITYTSFFALDFIGETTNFSRMSFTLPRHGRFYSFPDGGSTLP